eukprot:1161761-Pelagomonas_calceolata.AAC.4
MAGHAQRMPSLHFSGKTRRVDAGRRVWGSLSRYKEKRVQSKVSDLDVQVDEATGRYQRAGALIRDDAILDTGATTEDELCSTKANLWWDAPVRAVFVEHSSPSSCLAVTRIIPAFGPLLVVRLKTHPMH